jgi:hypothetical protein
MDPERCDNYGPNLPHGYAGEPGLDLRARNLPWLPEEPEKSMLAIWIGLLDRYINLNVYEAASFPHPLATEVTSQ